MSHDEHAHLAGPEARSRIWKVFVILTVITVAEFIIAFTMDRGFSRNVLFIVMTIVKAFFIVAYFMHLRDEVRGLTLTILLPLSFIVWLIISMLVEGGTLHNGWFHFLAG